MDIIQLTNQNYHLVVDLFDKYRVFYHQPSDSVLAKRYIKARIEKNESVIFVALSGGRDAAVPVGFTQLYPTYSSVKAVKNWILNDLYVDKAHRRKGIGEKLIGTAMEFARREGALFVQLETAVDNMVARRLYESIGFVKQPQESDFLLYRIGL